MITNLKPRFTKITPSIFKSNINELSLLSSPAQGYANLPDTCLDTTERPAMSCFTALFKMNRENWVGVLSASFQKEHWSVHIGNKESQSP